MPPDAGPYDVPCKMEDDNISVDSEDEGFVVLGMEDGDSGQDEDDDQIQSINVPAGYMPLTDNDDPGGFPVSWECESAADSDNAASNFTVNGVPKPSTETQSVDANITCACELTDETGREPFFENQHTRINSPHGIVCEDHCQALQNSSSNLGDMTTEHADLVKQAMASFTLPSANIPDWAKEIPEEKWKESLFSSITKREESK